MTSPAGEDLGRTAGPGCRPVDTRALRQCLGHYATGVAVVTYDGEDGPRGTTINSFTSVSMDPPLVLVSLARQANAARLLPGRPFTVNVLSCSQLDVALQFAGRPQPDLRVPWSPDCAVPRLRRCVAWVQCEPWAVYDGGDHLLFLGRVTSYDQRRGEPLLFHHGQFRVAGMGVHDPPSVTQPGGRPIARWVGQAHQLCQVSEPGYLGT
jgi:flavin reductase (DIM6/NTAB) family NADH-FMN oxidoreductase RutF